MRRFWGFYQNESYSVGCSGASVYVFDKEGKELARFRDFPYAYSAAFMPGHDNILAVKSTDGVLGFYDLNSLSLIKKIRITRIGAQNGGFAFSPDGSLFYNIEAPDCSTRTQLGVYETKTFAKISTLFAEDERLVLNDIEFDAETQACYLLGFMRDAKLGAYEYGFVASLDTKANTIQGLYAIEQKLRDYLLSYKIWENSGFTEKMLEWSPLKHLEHIEKTSIKAIYEAMDK